MLSVYLLFFTLFSALAQTDPNIKVVPTPNSIEDFEHQNKGCPENSECDQVMGLQLQKWKELLKKLRSENIEPEKKASYLELFRSKYGIPVEFYTSQKSQKGFKPLLFSSPCREHNPKDPSQKTLTGQAFVKNITASTATIWRDQTQIEVPLESGLISPQPLSIFYPSGVKNSFLPLNDQPLYIKNNEIHILKEYDEFFYMLAISPKGEWKIKSLDFNRLSFWQDKKEETKCPDEKKAEEPFHSTFCKTVWNEDTNSKVIMRVNQGCFI
jgi:hypothetical protein